MQDFSQGVGARGGETMAEGLVCGRRPYAGGSQACGNLKSKLENYKTNFKITYSHNLFIAAMMITDK